MIPIAKVFREGDEDGTPVGVISAGDAVVLTVREFFLIDGGSPTFGAVSEELRAYVGKRVAVIPIEDEAEPS